DRQGRLISCEHETRRITRTEYDGSITVLMDGFEGKRLNSPNDVSVKSDDSIWFSDPPFGIRTNYQGNVAPSELPSNIYRLDPRTGRAAVVEGTLDLPNGVEFSPDESKCYIEDSGPNPRPIYAYGHLEKFLSPTPHESDSVTARGNGRMERAGHGAKRFFDVERRLEAISAKGDPLETIKKIVRWEDFRADIEAVTETKPEERKSNAGRKPYDTILKFKIVVLQSLHNLSDEQTEYLIRDRLSFMRFLDLELADAVPDATTIWLFREALAQAGLIDRLFERFGQHL